MKVSISLGGSLLTRERTPQNFRRYADALRKLKEEGHQLIVVCGGGRPAREYISMARELGAGPDIQDRFGILASHLNALLLIAALGEDAHPHIHRRGSEIKRNLGDKILVGGGHLPGSSTDYRAVLFAEAADADLVVNATDYGGVFNKDPGKHTDAKQYERLTFQGLVDIIKHRFEQAPGDYGLFDLKAAKHLRKIQIPLVIIDGTDPEEIVRAVEGGHRGTEIRDSA
ncbi:MAG: UMP kinase [Candidatus Bathyarchaeota archaeon]|nr:MAG: UMP kinase [Candidatus Bathyarchaeota archaeon]